MDEASEDEEWEQIRREIAGPDQSPPQSDAEQAIARIHRETHLNHFQNVWSHPETCLWLNDASEYQEWIKQRQSVLCVTGSPGSGKTCLAYSVMQNPGALQEPLNGKSPLVLVFAVSLSRGQVSDFLRSIVLQIHYSGHISLLHMIQETLPWTEDGLDDKLQQIVLRAIMQLCQTIPVLLIINGVNNLLDECLSQLATILSTLMDRAVAEDVECRILYTKREYPVMQGLASIFRNWSCIRMDSLNQQDIYTYVKGKVESILWYLETQTTAVRLSNFITEAAGTCFEVANAYTTELVRVASLRKDPESITASLPGSVCEMWHRTIRDLLDSDERSRSRTLSTLQWLLAAQRPLTLAEFCWLCAAPFEDDVGDMLSAVITTSCGLLGVISVPQAPGASNISTQVVSFVQPSLRTYMESDACAELFSQAIRLDREEFLEQGHASFFSAGVRWLKTYLPSYRDAWMRSLPKFPDRILSPDSQEKTEPIKLDSRPALGDHPGLEYTARYLISHMSKVRPTDDLEGLVKDLGKTTNSDGKSILFSMWAHLHSCFEASSPLGSSISMLHVLARHNMAEWLSWAITSNWDYMVMTSSRQTILHWAAFHGSKEAVDVICQHESTRELVTRANCALAHSSPYSAIWEVSLVDRGDDNGNVPLELAACMGHADIVTMLLLYHRDLKDRLRKELVVRDVERDEIETSVQLIGSAFKDSVRLVGTEVIPAEETAVSTLYIAIQYDHPDVVEVLIRHGLDWNLLKRFEMTPLEFALARVKEMPKDKPLAPAAKAIIRQLTVASFETSGNSESFPSSTAKVVEDKFEATKVQVVNSGVTSTRIPVSAILQSARNWHEKSSLTWVHLPANNMQWVEILITRLMEQKGAKYPKLSRDKILRRDLWTERQTRGSPRSYISFMRPLCTDIEAEEISSTVLFMPYIHWETQSTQLMHQTFLLCKFLLEADSGMLPSLVSALASENDDLVNDYARLPADNTDYANVSRALKDFLRSMKSPNADLKAMQESLKSALSLHKDRISSASHDLQLIDCYATNDTRTHPLHLRRTLDQSLYYMLDSTATRNKNQVVSRYGRERNWKQPVVLMVDQLWLWCIDNVIISAFPLRQACSPDDPDRYDMTDVLEKVIANIRSRQIDLSQPTAQVDLMLKIIEECVGMCMDPERNVEHKFRFLDMFSNSISKIADGEVVCYERFVNMLGHPGQQGRLGINTESYLLREIKDIQDELRMIKFVLVDQHEVLQQLKRLQSFSSRLGEGGSTIIADQSVSKALKKVNSMQHEAERTHDQLNALMDLRQRHATLWEAQSTGLQGNTIMVFTVVTILFLPASFMTSFFALPVIQFSYHGDDNDQMNLRYVVTWIMVFTIPVALLFISLAFYINNILDFLSRITGYGVRRAKKAAKVEKMQTGLGFLPDEELTRGRTIMGQDSSTFRRRRWLSSRKKRLPDDPA